MDTNRNQHQELIAFLESIMDFKKWGFKQSYVHSPEIIYNSQWCRVKFYFDYYAVYPHPHIGMYAHYGRVHAPNNDYFMIYKGEKCWCWHELDLPLRFLDDMTPKEAADEWNAYLRWPPGIRQFIETTIDKKIHSPEWNIRIQHVSWEHYGQRLFELFDLRQPALWERYNQFVKEFYKIIDSRSYVDGAPPRDRIC
jgi:hypothetical protein